MRGMIRQQLGTEVLALLPLSALFFLCAQILSKQKVVLIDIPHSTGDKLWTIGRDMESIAVMSIVPEAGRGGCSGCF